MNENTVEWTRHHIRAGKYNAFCLNVAMIFTKDKDSCLTIMSPNKESAERAVKGIVEKLNKLESDNE